MRKRAAFVLSAVLLVVAVTACRDDAPTCYAGEYAACNCAGGARGYQICLASEDGYAACVCDGTTPGLDAGVAETSAVDAARDGEGGSGGGLHKDAAEDAEGGD
jgi:hypothetical protein